MKTQVGMIVLLLCALTACGEKNELLTAQYADFMHRNPGGKRIEGLSEQERQASFKAVEDARRLTAEGYQLYRQKKDADAVKKYEEALRLHAFGELYYNYANSLSNVDRLEDAVKAYRIAIDLHTGRQELAFYNLACAYSRLQQAEKAYSALAQAIERGYGAFTHIEKDADMAYLRSQPDWRERITALRPPNITYGREALAEKILRELGPREADLYYLCKNGVVLKDHFCGNGFNRGTWRVDEGGNVQINLTHTCWNKYVGPPIDHSKYAGAGAIICHGTEAEFAFGGCREMDIADYPGGYDYRHRKVEASYIKQMLAARGSSPDYGDGYDLLDVPEEEPVQCDPGFTPESKADLIISAFEPIDEWGERR